ncbi:hypothetical protein [Streptomyces sp. NBC_00568]|uniref:hypothetical protein n=1 Tax=Streptomyces sp. NBC_00568 TaxID=2975779 RepID=UPI00224D725D|nr:hypothetical protein [Streptomyces sp. NBC_00568]MCX4993421.1 hypothetical protein [Streptomyces sp. NBC_00568]
MDLTVAAQTSRDVGDRIGWDMSEGWGMLGAAILAGIFAIVAGVIAYRAGRRQVADQGLIEHRHWQRQNRLEAYQRILTSSDAFTTAMDAWRIPTTRASANLGGALETLAAAEAGVRLVGPAEMHTPAKAVVNAAGDVYRRTRTITGALLFIPPAQWVQLSQALISATNQFVTQAATVLDTPTE